MLDHLFVERVRCSIAGPIDEMGSGSFDRLDHCTVLDTLALFVENGAVAMHLRIHVLLEVLVGCGRHLTLTATCSAKLLPIDSSRRYALSHQRFFAEADGELLRQVDYRVALCDRNIVLVRVAVTSSRMLRFWLLLGEVLRGIERLEN